MIRFKKLTYIHLKICITVISMHVHSRISPKYNNKTRNIIDKEKIIFDAQLSILKAREIVSIYENQNKIATSINITFNKKTNIFTLIIAPCQSGKTGSMCALVEEFLKNGIPIDNIYIITGLSSNDWVEQTKDRMPDCLHKNIYHRPDLLETFVEDVKH